MTTRMYGRTLGALALSLFIVAACGGTAASPAASGSPGDSVAAASASPTPTDAAVPSDSAVPSGSAVPSDTAAASATPAPAARVAYPWVRGQTLKQYDLVAPGKGWVYTDRNVWQTIDDGTTWAKATPPRLIVSKIRGLGAFDANHALLAVVDVFPGTTVYYIWRTSNAGQTWAYTALPGIPNAVRDTPCAPGDFRCDPSGDPWASFDNVDASTAFVTIHMRSGIDVLNPYIFQTTDGGATWAPRTYEPPAPPTAGCCIYEVNFMTRNIGVVEFGDQISSTITGWGHWTHRRLPSDEDYLPAIDFVSETKWYGHLGLSYGTTNYRYTISTDQGRFWTDYTSIVPGIANLHAAHVQFLGPLVWIGTEQTYASFASGPSQTIYTTDAGRHWELMGPQPFNGSRAFFIDATHGWTANGTTLYSTSNGGRSWRLLTP